MKPKAMDTNGEPPLSPQNAAAALARLENYHELLTARAFGMTLMAFGIASAATSLAYAHATDWFVDHDVPYLLSLLWLPFILSAGILTGFLWRTHALTLGGNDEDDRGWLQFVVFSLGYIAILAGVSALDAFTDIGLGPSAANLVTLGLFTLLLAVFLQKRHKPGRIMRPTYVAGFALLVAGPVLSRIGLDETLAGLVGALLALVAWVGAGIATARQG